MGGEGRATAKWEEKGRDQATETQTVSLEETKWRKPALGLLVKGRLAISVHDEDGACCFCGCSDS